MKKSDSLQEEQLDEKQMKNGKRDYKAEYEEYHSKPEQKKNNSMRHKARRKMGLKTGDNREVDHKVPLSKGGSNSTKNLRVVSRTTNRKKHAKENTMKKSELRQIIREEIQKLKEGISTTIADRELEMYFNPNDIKKIKKLQFGKKLKLKTKDGDMATITPQGRSGKPMPGHWALDI